MVQTGTNTFSVFNIKTDTSSYDLISENVCSVKSTHLDIMKTLPHSQTTRCSSETVTITSKYYEVY